MEKTFERILNKHIQDIHPYTDAQAGGRPGRSTSDQLFILKSVMKQAKEDGRQLYIAFLWNAGVRGKICRILRLLNKNVKAQVKTKYGLTRIITMEDNIRQGGVYR